MIITIIRIGGCGKTRESDASVTENVLDNDFQNNNLFRTHYRRSIAVSDQSFTSGSKNDVEPLRTDFLQGKTLMQFVMAEFERVS